MNTDDDLKGAVGFRRLLNAFGYSYHGLVHAMVNESAIRQELVALTILIPIAAWLPVSRLERLILILLMLLVLLVEFLNTAIESAIDRISMERHPLSGQAKDLASAAVAVALLMSGLCWLVIAGPIVVRLFD